MRSHGSAACVTTVSKQNRNRASGISKLPAAGPSIPGKGHLDSVIPAGGQAAPLQGVQCGAHIPGLKPAPAVASPCTHLVSSGPLLPISPYLGLTPKVDVAERPGEGAQRGYSNKEGFDPGERSGRGYLPTRVLQPSPSSLSAHAPWPLPSCVNLTHPGCFLGTGKERHVHLRPQERPPLSPRHSEDKAGHGLLSENTTCSHFSFLPLRTRCDRAVDVFLTLSCWEGRLRNY